jgi:hypothetical protein
MGYNTTLGAFDAYTAAGWVSVTSSATVSGPAFAAYMSANQSVSASTWTKMAFDTKYFDTDTCYNTTTYRFTPTKAGIYQINVNGNSLSGTGNFFYQGLYKNGVRVGLSGIYIASTNLSDDNYMSLSYLTSMNGSTDYIEAWGITNISGGLFSGGATDTSFSATWIRSN